MVFDTLFGLDESYTPRPQMVSGFTTAPDGKDWTLTLRDGLTFHDGTPVLARDCVASVARWGKRDAFGGGLMAATDELSAPDDRTIRFRLKRPFPLLPDALGKVGVSMCPIMPERLAKTDPFTQVTEMVGSGPYRFLAGERVPGAKAVYARFDGYVPRPRRHRVADGRAQGGEVRPHRMEHDSGRRDRAGGVAGRRGGLVGAAELRPAARDAGRRQAEGRQPRSVGLHVDAAHEPALRALRQSGDPPGAARRRQPAGIHDRRGGDRPGLVAGAGRLLPADLAARQRCRDGGADGAARPSPRSRPTSRPRATRASPSS